MKAFRFIFIFLLMSLAGCQQESIDIGDKDLPKDVNNPLLLYAASLSDFSPRNVGIMPLSEVTMSSNGSEGHVRAFVSLHDSFNCQQKWPAVFRFEIYTRLFRTAQPKGKRVYIWPDIDLTDAKENNSYWQDFLRAYEFDLSFDANGGKDYILQVTCIIDEKRRISAELPLRVEEPEETSLQPPEQ